MNREAKKKLTRFRIVEASMELFENQGYESTTVQQIATRADVAKGTFFNYFSSKEDLILELQGSLIRREIENQSGLQGPIMPQLLNGLLIHARQYPLTQAVTRAVLQGVYGSERIGSAQSERSGEFARFLAMIIRKGQERGEIRTDLSAEKIAGMAVQCYYGVLMSWVLQSTEETLEDLMRCQFEIFTGGIRPEAAGMGERLSYG
ncbi:TetR/AcrR family transcriptional regulator [Cohnella lubricantis]|uniref:TetR/AcrR family transcriptional regulator n=1 Tax=Cohnella lubricantis TaxID=2163172 RepID=A0A841THD9_9BACL|nr:TetR/AcrR family transcriptional regulator [Cohnella lubricantis]MBB6678367.1 TetR/AcrR family transcriptional regulator [Cohnella lubricantis]MBP2116747.1 AcrR family transcriptional regulator [Cohnella lubricantis]